MIISRAGHFDASPRAVAVPVRITWLYDAQVFTCGWVIRDKDRDLKTLLRKREKANSGASIDEAMVQFKRALSARALLNPKPFKAGGRVAPIAGGNAAEAAKFQRLWRECHTL